MATLDNYRTRISAELGLDNTASSTEQVLIDARVNEGVLDFMLQTGCKVASATMALTANTKDYTLDTAILKILDVYVTSSGSDSRLRQTGTSDIIDMRLNGHNVVQSPVSWYSLEGANLFMVYPTPLVADTVTLYYIPRPATLSTGSDTPTEIPTEFHAGPEFYALWRLASYDDDQSSQQGDRYYAQYQEWARRCRAVLNRKGGRRLPRARVGGRGFVSSDPSRT